jgi:hypothetical protein
MVPDDGIQACDRERTQDPDGKRSAAGGGRVADVQARVTEPVTGEPGLRHAACHRTDRRFRVVGTRHPVAIGERVHEPTGRSAGVPGREQPEAESPGATCGCALLDCPPLCGLPR